MKMKKYFWLINMFLSLTLYSQSKVGLYPIYFETNVQKTAFENSYTLNGYNYIDAKHPLVALMGQDTSWYWFDYLNTKTFIKLPDKEGTGGGSGAISEIIDTFPDSVIPTPILIARHVNGVGDTVGIYIPYGYMLDWLSGVNKNKIAEFVDANDDSVNIYETITSMGIIGDSLLYYVDEIGDTTYTQIDKTLYGIPVSSTPPESGQILKFNGSMFVPADDDVSGGTGVDGVVSSAAFSGTTTKTLTLTRTNGLSNLTANFTDNVNDADYNPSNELQTLSITDSTNRVFSLNISAGNTVKFKDTKLTQEEVEDYVGAMVSGNTETGITVTYQDSDGTVDFVATDPSTSNELQTISKNPTTRLVTLNLGGGTFTDEIDDADHDPTNENQTVSAGFGIDVTHAGQDYNVKADTAELATVFRVNNLKDYFNFDYSVVKSFTSGVPIALKQVTIGGNAHTVYTTTIESYLEFLQGYIEQTNTGIMKYDISVYKRYAGSSSLINTISVNSTGIGKYYFYYNYGTVHFNEGEEFYIVVTSDTSISDNLINYTIYFSRDLDWTGDPR